MCLSGKAERVVVEPAITHDYISTEKPKNNEHSVAMVKRAIIQALHHLSSSSGQQDNSARYYQKSLN